MIIFSHRGLGFGMEENSLESYKKAIKENFSIEIDVQKTRDDKIVISHDLNLKRQKKIDKNITDMNYEELKKLKIPSLQEVLDLFKKNKKEKQKIAIHIKDELQGKIVELILDKIIKKQLEEDCFIFDLTKNYSKHAKLINNKIQVGISIAEKNYTGTIYTFKEIKDDMNIDIIWLDEWNSKLYTTNKINEIKKINKKIYAISPELHKNDNHPLARDINLIKKVWKRLIELGIDGICTDFPLELKNFIKELACKQDKYFFKN